MDPVWWSEALKRDPRVDGHADAWLRYVASNALLSSILDLNGIFLSGHLEGICFLYQLMLPKLNGNGRSTSIILFCLVQPHMCQGLNSHYFHIIWDGHQPNSRGLYTHYMDSY